MKTDSAWPKQISAFKTSAGSNPSHPVNNLLPTPSSASNCMASMAHAMASGSTGAILIMMSEGMQV